MPLFGKLGRSSTEARIRDYFSSRRVTLKRRGMQNLAFFTENGKLVLKTPQAEEDVLSRFREINPQTDERALRELSFYYFSLNLPSHGLAKEKLGDRVVPFYIISNLAINVAEGERIEQVEFPIAIIQNRVSMTRGGLLAKIALYASMGNGEMVRQCIDDLMELYQVCIRRGVLTPDMKPNDVVADDASGLLKFIDCGAMEGRREIIIGHITGQVHCRAPLRTATINGFRESLRIMQRSPFPIKDRAIDEAVDYLGESLIGVLHRDNLVPNWDTQEGVPLKVEFEDEELKLAA